MENQTKKLKIYVLTKCPACEHRIYIKELMTPTEVEEIMTEEHVTENKEKIKSAILEKKIFKSDEEMALALKQVDDENAVWDDQDTQQAIEVISIESLRKNNDKPATTEKTEDNKLSKS